MKRIACLALAVALVPSAALAIVQCDSPDAALAQWDGQAPWRKSLAERKFAEVDRYLNGLLAENAAGKATDADVDFLLGATLVWGKQQEPLYAEWTRAFPKSEAAHLGYAYYLIGQGWAARGSDYASQTTRSQLDAMAAAFKRSAEALDEAERLSRKPTLEWAKKIEIMRAGGMRPDDPATALYLKAIEKHPGTLAVRTQYIVAAAPRWGGSTERLAHVVEHSKKLPEAERRYIAAQVDHEIGMMHLHMRKDGKSASQAFERAMAECPGFSESAAQVMGIYSEQHDYPRLIAASTHYINRKPGHGWGYRVRGWAYGNSGKLPESFKDYQRATQLGDTESYLILASFYENAVGGVKQDFQKALDLYQVAQEKGVPGAQEKAQRLRKIANIK